MLFTKLRNGVISGLRRIFRILTSILFIIVILVLYNKAIYRYRVSIAKPLLSVTELYNTFEIGDVLFSTSLVNDGSHPIIGNLFCLLNKQFIHGHIIVSVDNKKYVLQCQNTKGIYRWRKHCPNYNFEEYLIASDGEWTVMLEPLELFLQYDAIPYKSSFEIHRTGKFIAVSRDPSQTFIQTWKKARKHFAHCCIVLGCLLAEHNLIKTIHKYKEYNYIPNFMAAQFRKYSKFYVKTYT